MWASTSAADSGVPVIGSPGSGRARTAPARTAPILPQVRRPRSSCRAGRSRHDLAGEIERPGGRSRVVVHPDGAPGRRGIEKRSSTPTVLE